MTETMQELIHRAISTGIKIKIPRKDWIFQWDKDRLVFKSNLDYCSYSPNVMLDFSELQEYIEPPKKVKQLTKFYCYKHQNQIKWFSYQFTESTPDYYKVLDTNNEHVTISYFVEEE